MRTISYRLEDLKKVTIHIGYVGENEHTRVNIDAGEVFAENPDAAVTMKVQPPRGTAYPVTVNRDGDIVTWDVKNSDLVSRGAGEIQMTFTEGTEVIKSCIARISIDRSIVGNGTTPDPVQDWIDTANEKLADVEEATTDAETAAGKIDDMTVAASGSAYGSDPTATITEVYGHKHVAFTIPAGQPGTPGDPTQLIDDTAGSGTTGKTWSADKIDGVTSQLSTAIHQINEGGNALTDPVKNALLNLFGHVTYTDGNAQQYIEALESAWQPTATLVSITADFEQGSTVIYDTDSLDTLKQYLTVIGNYTTFTQEITNYTLSGTLSEGTSTITVTVGVVTTTFTVNVTSESDYELYTKIIATGQQYIDPNLYETDLTGCYFEYKAVPNSTQASSGHILSSQNNYVAFPQLSTENSQKYGRITAKIAGGTEAHYGSLANPAWTSGDEITVVAYADSSNSVSLNSVTVIQSVTAGSTSSSSKKYTIFAYGNNPTDTGYRFRGKLYYLKIYNSNNVLIHHFVPAKKKSTSKYGLYDTVTENFFSSSTSTEFTVE